MKKSKRRARGTSKPPSVVAAPPAFTADEEAFFSDGVEASETGRFERIEAAAAAEPPPPGLLQRFLSRVRNA